MPSYLVGGKQTDYNPKLTTARARLAKIESEIEKLLDTLTGANPTLLKYANNRIEELDAQRQAQRQAQTKLIADLSANSVSSSQIELKSGYLSNWSNVEFDDKRRVIDALVTQIQATSEHVSIQWKI